MGIDISLSMPRDLALFAFKYYDIVKDMNIAQATAWFMSQCPERDELFSFGMRLVITEVYEKEWIVPETGEIRHYTAKDRTPYAGQVSMTPRRRFMAWRSGMRRAMLAFPIRVLIMNMINENPDKTE